MAERSLIYTKALERILADYASLVEERYRRAMLSESYRERVRACNVRRKAMMEINRIKRQMK